MIEEKAKKGVTLLVGITISDYHEKLELLLHNGGRIEYICHSDDPLGSLYSMSDDSGEWTTITAKVNHNGKATKGSNPLKIKCWV